MDFIPQPEDAKRIGSMKWFKWNLMKYPNIFAIAALVPPYVFLFLKRIRETQIGLNDGTYVPGVIRNRYTICRPGEFLDVNTPKRYKN